MSLTKIFSQADKHLEKMTVKTEKEIIKAYSESLKSIRAQLADVFARFGTDDSLDYSVMQKYNRLAHLEQEIISELRSLTGKNAKSLTTSLFDMFEESYLYTVYAVESEAQIKLGMNRINRKIIEKAIQNPITGLTLNDRLKKNRNDVIINIRQQITQGLIQGESYQKMARRIKSTLEGDVKKAMRVVQTEAHRVQQQGRLDPLDKFEEKGIKLAKVWVATLDDRTRDSHQDLDGQHADKDGFFELNGMTAEAPGMFGVAEEDINCRCTFRIEILDYAPEVRRARNQGIIPYTTYRDWKENRVA
ncbi:hypothetical protein BHU72_11970 [Desulfuribacillus stibiiarsenatis]|uniref:Phage head morphogenesis domain-containing protein n=1 Tax=Desulfuribacillus stibiiarsenatis TaxID=1390249 RepID=A0A1E5L897_9FIRM|nr:phage minor head protein [Desulfuribacillus stibiiarsenatis]OEH86244.1 hypothetical protein BHU72_11970 [Desulfuribacillus stibiiarsenatis]